jgi:glycosyltransferase involved in cell wall biosynthesis
MSEHFDVSVVYEHDHGMVARFPPGVAKVAPTAADRERAIRDSGADLVVVIDSPNFIDAWRAVDSPGRLVLEVHTTTTNVGYLTDLTALAGVAHIVTVSAYMEQRLRVAGLGALAPISIVSNCLDDRWRAPATPSVLEGRPVAWVGKLDTHKRWRTAVDLVDRLCEDDTTIMPVLIGGLTSPEAEVAALTTRLATSEALARGHWWPKVEYDRMPAVYATVGFNGGVHLSTTVNESFGMAVAESIMQGCPVIAPSVGALPELLPAPALYPSGDWAAARAKVRQALDDHAFRAELLSTAESIEKTTRPETAVGVYRELVAGLF